MRLIRVLVLAMAAATSASAGAQAAPTAAQRLTEDARAQLGRLNADSAFVLLTAALDRATTSAERLRPFTLLGFAQLARSDEAGARQAFERALAIDPTLKIDSLVRLDDESPRIFAQAVAAVSATRVAQPETRAAPPPRIPIAVEVSLADTTIAAENARLPIVARPNASARIITTISPADAPERPIWSDTQVVAGRATVVWPLRAGGSVLPDGRYLLRMRAVDSTSSAVVERFVRLTRVPADTQPHPAGPAASSFAPETSFTGGRKPRLLLTGASLAALAVATPILLGNKDLNAGLSSDPTAFAVGGGVALVSVIRFAKGRRQSVLLPQNVARNRQLRDDAARQLESTIRENAAARERAPIRIVVERPS